MTCILSLDVGTSSVKGALISPEGEIFYNSSHSYQEGGFFYQYDKFSVSLWNDSFFKVFEDLLSAVRGSVIAISVSANAPSLIPLSKKGEAMGRVLHHLAFKADLRLPTESFYLSELKAFSQRFPALYEEVDYFLTVSEYFVFLLTGERVTASPCEKYDVYFWEECQLEAYGLDAKKMAPFVRSGEIVGHTLGRQGEPKGIPVVLAGIDYLSSLLGAGAVEEGFVTDRAGTSEGFNLCAREGLRLSPFYCLPQLPIGLMNMGAMLGATGFSLDCMRHLGKSFLSFSQTFRQIEALGEHQNLFYLSPHPLFWQYSLDKGTYKGSTQGQDAWGLARARLEAIGFSLRGILDFWRSADLKVGQSIRLSGGQAKSEAWNQLKANLLGKPLDLLQILDVELLGNAILAVKALGLAKDLTQASQKMVKVVKRIEPEALLLNTFTEKYEQFKYLSSNHRF